MGWAGADSSNPRNSRRCELGGYSRWAAGILLVRLCCACAGTPDPAVPELRVSFLDSAGTRILELSHTLQEIARGQVQTVQIKPDLRVGYGKETWFASIADLASLGRGRFAVFDRIEKHIVIVDSTGNRIAVRGGQGKGPGEYQY